MEQRRVPGRELTDLAGVAMGGGILGALVEPAHLALGLGALASVRLGLRLLEVFRRWRNGARRSAPGVIAGLSDVEDDAEKGLAVTDAITGLANRRALTRVLEAQCRVVAQSSSPLAVVALAVQDAAGLRRLHGSEAEREALRQSGRRLAAIVGAGGSWGAGTVTSSSRSSPACSRTPRPRSPSACAGCSRPSRSCSRAGGACRSASVPASHSPPRRVSVPNCSWRPPRAVARRVALSPPEALPVAVSGN
jgi:hypothetical protein